MGRVDTRGDPARAASVRSAMDRVRGVVPGPLRRAIDETVMFAPGTR
jgi:hypothetical protein